MEKYAVIVAGGAGLRMGTTTPKQFLLLHYKPVLWHTLHAFLQAFDDMQIILVVPAAHYEIAKAIVETTTHPQRIQITTGGETRFHSVKNGLQLIKINSIVFVHDAVRCLVTVNLIRNCYANAIEKGNAIPAIAATDSIRIETALGNTIVDRNTVRVIQTPQTFLSGLIVPAFEQPYNDGFTDEATVVEKMGVKINLIQGEITNIKITRPIDLLIAEKILEDRQQ